MADYHAHQEQKQKRLDHEGMCTAIVRSIFLIHPDVVASALDKNIKKGEKIIYLSPRGKRFDQKTAKALSKEKKLNLICGHFEGIDQRLLETRDIEEYSLGDFILSGGETASFVLID